MQKQQEGQNIQLEPSNPETNNTPPYEPLNINIKALPPLKNAHKTPIDTKNILSIIEHIRQQKYPLKKMNYSLNKKQRDDKFLKEYTQKQKRKLASLSTVKASESERKEVFRSTKMGKIGKIKPLEVRPQIQAAKDQYRLRQQSIIGFLSNQSMLQEYKMLSHLGKGSFSIVSLAVNKQSNKRFAMKTYTKIDQIQSYKFDNIYREINNLTKLSHDNVIGLFHVIKDKRKLHLIMQDGGKLSLAGLLRKNKTIEQANAKVIFKQIVEGVKYCHQQGVCHRDLKLENILLNSDNFIKIIDFGFSAKSGQRLQNFCGTPPYMAPQITVKLPYYGNPADIWALGIILYLMLYGKFPFRATSQKELYRLIQVGKFEHSEGVSVKGRQMLNRLLRCSVKERITAQQILGSSWFDQK